MLEAVDVDVGLNIFHVDVDELLPFLQELDNLLILMLLELYVNKL